MIEQGNLILVPFPFSDQSGRKVRPVVVLSNDEFNEHSQDIIAVGITSNISKDRYSLNLDNRDLKEGKLVTRCVIKVENILRLDKSLIIKKIGKIKEEKLDKIIRIFNEIIKGQQKP
ncbi:MAG: type II toxin-antitoxin system PemK/MazF family toxin [Nanoarchaeota archaeon]